MKASSSLVPLILTAALWATIAAHRSLPSGVTCGNQFNSSTTALTIPDPKISWASYRILSCDAPIFWLKGQVDAGQMLSFTAGLPVLSRFSGVRVSVVIIGPGLPQLSGAEQAKVPAAVIANVKAGEGAFLIETPSDQSTCNHVHSKEMTASSQVKDNRCHFHEEYGDSHSWVLIDDNRTALATGEHRFAIFTITNQAAKVWFACCDWPEDFATQHSIPDAACPACGTKASFGQWSSLFYEQKSMAKHGGFPSADTCTLPPVASSPTAAQCPEEKANDNSAMDENCVLGCSKGECHSHNIMGVCTYPMFWVTPRPKLGNADVNRLLLFVNESVKFYSAGHMFAHNLIDMGAAEKLTSCDFAGTTEAGNVEELNAGKTIKFTKAGTYYYACQIGNHCVQGQKVEIVVKDTAEGKHCHSHEHPKPETTKCPEGTVKANIVGDASYGAQAGQCSELCTSKAALAWMAGAKEGSCAAEFDTMVKKESVQPVGSPMAMEVIIMGKSETPCADGTVKAHMIGQAAYGAKADECSELCTTAASMQWMTGAKQGSCNSAGYGSKVTDKKVQPPGSPMAMDIAIMKQATDCHCHSYEEIKCGANGQALYDEHIVEIEQHCQGIIAGTNNVCPYKCFQPFEILHINYMECDTRPPHPTYIKINATAKCHKAASEATACGGSATNPEPETEPAAGGATGTKSSNSTNQTGSGGSSTGSLDVGASASHAFFSGVRIVYLVLATLVAFFNAVI